MKRDIHGRFIKPFNWAPIKWTVGLASLLALWAGSIWFAIMIVSDPIKDIPVEVDEKAIFDQGYRMGLIRGSDDTLHIFADLTALGHPWDYTEIQLRLSELNPVLQQ